MAYKRQSPGPIVEGYTNAITMANVNGVAYFTGAAVAVTSSSPAGGILTSNGAGMAPTFQAGSGGSGASVVGFGQNQVSGVGPSARYLGATTSDVYSCMFGFRNVGLNGASTNQSICPNSGNFSNMYVYISENNSTASVAVTLYVNGSSTALTVTITASTTGLFSNTVNTVAITAGQSAQIFCQQTTTGNIYGNVSMRFQ